MKKSPVAFAALPVPMILSAISANVTFDAALTNTTEWTYSSDVKHNATGYYTAGHGARIASPAFAFAITSVVLHVKTTSSCTRNLVVSSYDPATSATRLSRTFPAIPKGADDAVVAAAWEAFDQVRAVSIESTEGAQNLYFLSAALSGVPIVEAPAGLRTSDISGTRCRLAWTNPENAASNRVDVSKITRPAEGSSVERKYDFGEFSNGGDTSQQTERIVSTYPDLDGVMLCLPTNSTGQIQLSSRDDKGILSIRGFESCKGLRLELVARHYDHVDEVKSVSVGYVRDGATNDFASVELTGEFSRSSVSLADVPDDARIVLNNSGNKKYHRVIIDELSFVRDHAVETNLVKTAFAAGTTTCSVKGLVPRTQYVARATAFDADGNESAPSDPTSFTTDDAALPLVLTLQ